MPVLLITGAGRGIGAATAKLAAARGYDVAITYKSDAKSAGDVVAAVKAQGRKAVAIKADMASEADVDRMFKETDALGRLTHFVYNAGIPGTAGRLESAASAMMREVVEVNVLGALWSMQHAIRRMSVKHSGQGGAVVLLSSVAADIGGPNEYVWYAASKGAIESMTYGLSKELAGDHIRVNCVSPGASETRIHADAGTPEKLAKVAPMIPMGRVGKPEESAEGILFLLSDAASYISGTVLRVAGGR
jgi:NAD(P)-dependent dehydrogenase (short-subunit alcohol dehydrogenase family)